MPVLFFVIFVTSTVFFFVLTPNDLKKLATSVIWINAYLANFFFWKAYGNYFSEGAEEAPLLHTWSLAVEEQYYFIWPIYIIIGLKLFGPRFFLLLTVLLLFITTYLSEVATNITIGAAYYLLPARIFELMAGSLLALSQNHLLNNKKSLNDALSIIGFTMIMFSAFTLNANSRFPGYNAILPTAGTTLLIYSGLNLQHQGIINRLLGLKPFVSIGLISYSLYLWHWPIAALANYLDIKATLITQLIMISLALLLSWFSWKFIENPFRKYDNSYKTIFKFYLAPAISFSLIASLVIFYNGFPDRFPVTVLKAEEALNSYPNKERQLCHAALRNSSWEPNPSCILGHQAGISSVNPSAILIGDSIANHFSGFIEVLATDAQISVQDYTLDSCPPIFGLEIGASSFKANACKNRNDRIIEYILKKDSPIETIIIAGLWPSAKTKGIYKKGIQITSEQERLNIIEQRFNDMLNLLVQNDKQVILIKNMPFLKGLKPNCKLKKMLFNEEKDCSTPNMRLSYIEQLFLEHSKTNDKLKIIDPSVITCNGKIENCRTEIDDTPIYRDGSHLNYIGSQLLGEQYILTNSNLLTNKIAN